MSEQEYAIGAVLRTAREAQGLSVQDAAQHLRLMNRQIVAMETEDFVSLGQPVFARGFVRNYARLLGLDPQALLQAMGGAHVEPVDIVQAQAVVLPGSWLTSGWLIAGLLALLVLTVVPIGLYAWLDSDAEELASPLAPSTQPAPAVSAPVAVPAPIEKTVEVPVSELSATGDAAGIPVAELTPAGAYPVPPAIKSEMYFEFTQDAWVEIKDGTGQVLHRHMNRKGSSLELSGQPPFSLVLGNAAHIRMIHNGRPLDLTPYVDGNVARFSLEE